MNVQDYPLTHTFCTAFFSRFWLSSSESKKARGCHQQSHFNVIKRRGVRQAMLKMPFTATASEKKRHFSKKKCIPPKFRTTNITCMQIKYATFKLFIKKIKKNDIFFKHDFVVIF